MDFFVSSSAPSRQRTDCAIVGVYDKGVLSDTAQALDKKIGGRLSRLVKRGDIRGKNGDALLLTDIQGAACERILVVGLGTRANFKRKQYRKAIASAVAALTKTGARDAVSYLGLEELADADAYTLARATVEVVSNAQYRVADHKTNNKRPKPTLTRFGVAVSSKSAQREAERGLEHGRGI